MGAVDVSAATMKVIEAGALFSFMLVVVVALCWFIIYLMGELRNTRKESTDALVNSTAVIAEFKEIVRAALHQKN